MQGTNSTNKYVQQVYNERDHYIVIGLTGRCGSGCSTTREILCGTRMFKPDDFLGQSKVNYVSNERRDQNIILNFAAQNPIKFDTIRVRDIITTFILDEPGCFFDLLNELYPYFAEGDGGAIKVNFYKYFTDEFLQAGELLVDFDDYTEINQNIWKDITNNVYDFIKDINEQQYTYLFNQLGRISAVIRAFLLEYMGENAFTMVYQYMGGIVRSFGQLRMPDSLQPSRDADNMYAISKRINVLIKILRRKKWIEENYRKDRQERSTVEKCPVNVVIDSIKNVFEADYLRARYQSFYLVALTLDEETRRQRLFLNKGVSEAQINALDFREQPSKIKKQLKRLSVDPDTAFTEEILLKLFGVKGKCGVFYANAFQDQTHLFTLQDVDSCVQNADILINNSGTTEDLSLKIMRYVCLMQHPGLVPPTIDERCMQVAQSAKLNSGCISRQVGAVVSNGKGSILSIGWNDAVSTEGNECINCIRRSFTNLVRNEDEMAYSYFELYNPEFRENLREIMQKVSNADSEEITDEQLFSLFIGRTKPLLKGVPLAFCFKDVYSIMEKERNQVHTRAQHGEENALERCDRRLCSGGTLYTTSSSCELCAKKALSYNIRRIVYIEPYSGITEDHVLGHSVQNGVKIRRGSMQRTESMSVELFTGATQGAYVKLYTPIFPLKDELKLRGLDLQ